MKADSFLIVLLSLKCFMTCESKSCPQGFVEPHCVKEINTDGICDGARKCELEHSRIAIKEATDYYTNSYIYIGASDALFEKYKNRTGWLWFDGSLVGSSRL